MGLQIFPRVGTARRWDRLLPASFGRGWGRGGGESENPMSREKKKKKNPFFKKNFKKKTVFGHPARA
jgi:hypothetical protein